MIPNECYGQHFFPLFIEFVVMKRKYLKTGSDMYIRFTEDQHGITLFTEKALLPFSTSIYFSLIFIVDSISKQKNTAFKRAFQSLNYFIITTDIIN